MSVGTEKRSNQRVTFSRGVPVRVVAIDGTWTRHCLMMDASNDGAKLTLAQSVEGLQLKEFFLLLSTMGSSFRRCELAWINGDDMGVRITEKPSSKPKKKK
jgi:PilZ domain